MTGPWSDQSVSLILVTVTPGGFSGVFVYSPSVGAGNLKAGITATSGTDPYGNTFEPNVFSTDGTVFAELHDKFVQWQKPGDAANAAPLLNGTPSGTNGNSLEIVSGLGKVTSTEAAMTLYDSQQAAASGIAGAIASGNAAIALPLTTTIVSDSWHTMGGMSAGWSVVGHATYTMLPNGWLGVAFKDLSPGTDTDGTVIWAAGSLPAAYQPANNHRVACYTDIQRVGGATSETAALEFEPDGSIQCYGIAAAATRVDLYAAIPLTS